MAGLTVLALDFDGVIWDSVGECWLIARRTWQKLHGSELPEAWEQQFRAGRWLVRTGEDFYVLVKLIEADPQRDFEHFPRAEFDRLRADMRRDMAIWDRQFYLERDDAREHDRERWLAVQRPYPEVVEELPRLQAAFHSISVATTKDEPSVRLLLSTVGLDLPVVGKGVTRDKADMMRIIAQKAGVVPQQVVFVDDLLENLEQAQQAGARVALAAWGYNTEAERQEARERDIPLVRLGQIAQDLA